MKHNYLQQKSKLLTRHLILCTFPSINLQYILLQKNHLPIKNELRFIRKTLSRVVQFVTMYSPICSCELRTILKLRFYIHIIHLCTQIKPEVVIQMKSRLINQLSSRMPSQSSLTFLGYGIKFVIDSYNILQTSRQTQKLHTCFFHGINNRCDHEKMRYKTKLVNKVNLSPCIAMGENDGMQNQICLRVECWRCRTRSAVGLHALRGGRWQQSS